METGGFLPKKEENGTANDFVVDHSVLRKHTGPGGKVAVSEEVETIGIGAFREQTAVTSVTFPAGFLYIGIDAFY